jgi:hypothetical protein
VIGPDGSPLTMADLPAPGTKRWVIRRKAEVIAAVRGGLLSLEEACSRYMLTVDEFLSWQSSIDQYASLGYALRAFSNTGSNNGLIPHLHQTTRSVNVASSSLVRELFTRLETGHL